MSDARKLGQFLNHYQVGAGIILQKELQTHRIFYTGGHQGDKMIFIIMILTLFFVLGSISPLLVTDDVQDVVMMER